MARQGSIIAAELASERYPAVMSQDLIQLAGELQQWLFGAALPLWWERGADHVRGGFEEALDHNGRPVDRPRRVRTQARQSYVYAQAGILGWSGPWERAAPHGLHYLNEHYRRPDGLYVTRVSPDGTVLDPTAMLYDQAFVLLALAWLHRSFPRDDRYVKAGRVLRARIEQFLRHPAGGFVEAGEHPFQANAQMHLFEASLAWHEFAPDDGWGALVDELAALALRHFIDPQGGFLREFFDAEWRPTAGTAGRTVEPGHQFEWAWLLERWGRMRGQDGARTAARRLFDAGMRGVDTARNVAIDELDDRLAWVRPTARLWPQTEWLKAALILSETAEGETRRIYLDAAASAARALLGYFETPVRGLWHDRMLPDGSFVDEPAPATSLYHIVCAIAALHQLVRARSP